MIAGCIGETLSHTAYGTSDEIGVDPFAGSGEGNSTGVCIEVDELMLCIGGSGGKDPQQESPKDPDVLKRGELIIIRRRERPEDEKPKQS